jgi:hypothetical protein
VRLRLIPSQAAGGRLDQFDSESPRGWRGNLNSDRRFRVPGLPLAVRRLRLGRDSGSATVRVTVRPRAGVVVGPGTQSRKLVQCISGSTVSKVRRRTARGGRGEDLEAARADLEDLATAAEEATPGCVADTG